MVQPHSQSSSTTAIAAAPAVKTLGELRASGHQFRSVKDEVRQNLLARLRAGEDPFPGILGFDETVRPHLERALIAGHDVILLGERGQGKTRLIRTLTGLLDEWSPVITACEINDHPYVPVCVRCRRLAAELGDELPVSWHGRDQRYGEKLATPDTSVGDLIGDIDPVKVAEGRTLGDPETIHYGLVPRTNRGVFSLNELPDLAERIQVSLLNVLEERDIAVRWCGPRPRWTRAPASRPGSRSRRPRPWSRRRSGAPRSAAKTSRSPGSATCLPSPAPCAARSSSRSARRAGRPRCSSTCSAARPPTRSAPIWVTPTCPGWWPGSPRAVALKPLIFCPPPSCCAESARCRDWPGSWNGWTVMGVSPSARRRPRSSSRSRACT